ncbi:MAG: CsgG/HfaB family protein [Nitrospirota bacterium]|nr:CsgG/HfaB family protein [Nitrospirota bacterium]
MWITRQLVVGATFIIVCATVLGNCSQAIPPLSSSTQDATPPSPSPVSSENLSPVPPPYSLAILPFEDYSNRADLSWLRQAIADMLVTDLALLPGVRVVSRHRLGEVLREQWLQHRGAFEESASVRLGRLVGARYLLSGLYYFVEGTLIVEAHLVDVERGAVTRTVRVSGTPESIPTVELELAARLGRVFSGSTKGRDPILSDSTIDNHGENDALLTTIPLADLVQDINREKKQYPTSLSSSMTLRTDTLLSMEHLRDLRKTAVTLADEIWENAVTVRLGSPQYQSLSRDSLASSQLLSVLVPVSAHIQPAWFRHAVRHEDLLEGKMIERANSIVLAFQVQDAGAQQLFVEAMLSPRRLFVRAIGDGGEVLGVSSQWSWRTDHHVQNRSDGTIEMSVSPQVLFKGGAEFSSALLAKHGATIRFDSFIASVSEEARVISIETISDPAQADRPEELPVTWTPILRTWLLQRWGPPVAESIPIEGYLPGNVRRGVAILSGVGGTVHSAQVIQSEAEAGVAGSIQEVISQLSGQCFALCDDSSSNQKITPKSFKIRVQFELFKDIRFAGLNRQP